MVLAGQKLALNQAGIFSGQGNHQNELMTTLSSHNKS
jgi:hypothetical protein